MDVFGSNPPGDRLALAPTFEVDEHPVAVYLAGLAPTSRRTMRTALRTVASLLAPEATETTLSWAALDYADVLAVRARLAGQMAPTSANRVLAAVRGVLTAAFRLGLVSADQVARVRSVESVRGNRVPKGRSLSAAELGSLFGVCDANTIGGVRNRALLATLYNAGLRRAEAVALDVKDFDRPGASLLVRGKGNRERRCFLGGTACAALDAWLGLRGQEAGPLFFPVLRSGAIVRRRLSDQAVAELLRHLAGHAGVRRFSPHDLRRTFIGDLLDVGVDLPTVQAMAGHANPSTTSRYDRRPDRTRQRAAALLHVPGGGVLHPAIPTAVQ